LRIEGKYFDIFMILVPRSAWNEWFRGVRGVRGGTRAAERLKSTFHAERGTRNYQFLSRTHFI
jgi:hypothetical protein